MKFMMLAIPVILALAACDQKPAEKPSPTMPTAPAASADRAKDPICGMMVDKATSTKTTHEGATYYFCADACLKKFQADPKKYQAHCACVKTAKKCECGHCAPKGETCDCN
jgi:YHS domain-containing protein